MECRNGVVDGQRRGRRRRRMPDFLQSVNLKYVKLGYHYLVTHLVTLLLLPLVAAALLEVARMGPARVWQLWLLLRLNLVSVLACSTLLVFAGTVYAMWRPRSVYLIDFSCYEPPAELGVTYPTFMRHSRLSGLFSESSLDFQRRILERSGVGEETCLPRALHALPACPSMSEARAEAEDVMFGACDRLLAQSGVVGKDIGLLIVNCSLFNPIPSLSAMLVNRYRMRSNVCSYNLSGMGCSAGVVAIDLARQLLQLRRHAGTLALVVSTENITQNWYSGNDRSMLISNCLFRVGGAAILLGNRRRHRLRAKYELLHTVRTHRGADQRSFSCVLQRQDDEGHPGVSLAKDLMAVAGEALKANITTLGPLVLPLSEQLLFLAVLLLRCMGFTKRYYIPDFKLAFEHFCIHAGGRAVIDELEKNLGLGPQHVEASRMTLHRFGNTSSSSIWYELAYLEAKGRVRRGDRVWQIALGSGFKCNSAVWRALRNVPPPQAPGLNPWYNCIKRYPVHVPEFLSCSE